MLRSHKRACNRLCRWRMAIATVSVASTVIGAPAKLPPGFEQAFVVPQDDQDQYGNPVVTRNGGRSDPATGYPFEIWLKEPRIEFVLVPAGEFTMGSPLSLQQLAQRYRDQPGWYQREKPAERVAIRRPFYIGKYEVTVAEFRKFVAEAVYLTDIESGEATVRAPRPRPAPGQTYNWRSPGRTAVDDEPVTCVTWRDALVFCEWLTDHTGLAGPEGMEARLPTEAEWEYACRAGTPTEFSFGDSPASLPQYAHCEGGHPVPVGQKRPNAWGVYDMHGNVWEWCQSLCQPYPYSENDGREDLAGHGRRIFRGGGYNSGMRRAYAFRCARRQWYLPTVAGAHLGFRVTIRPEAQARTGAAAPQNQGRQMTHEGTVCSVAFSPDGKTFASGGGTSEDGEAEAELMLWDVRTGMIKKRVKEHRGRARQIARPCSRLATQEGGEPGAWRGPRGRPAIAMSRVRTRGDRD